MTAGPMAAMALIELTNRPAPMMPPMEIIAICRVRRERASFGVSTASDASANGIPVPERELDPTGAFGPCKREDVQRKGSRLGRSALHFNP